jgi:F-type H+-transporting ATPase subunit b
MDSFITTFHIDWKIIIAQGINFIVVLAVLYFLALKPLKKVMSERTANIEKGLDDAKQNAILLENSRKDYEAVIAKAKLEAHELFQQGKIEAEDKKQEMIQKAQVEVDLMIANGKKSLEAEKAKMMDEAKKEIVALVVSATEKVLADHKDKSINEKTLKNISKM